LHRTCNKPGKQETVQSSVERIGASVVVVAILTLVANPLNHVGQILDDAEAASDNQIDWDVAFIRTVIEKHGPCTAIKSAATFTL